MRNKKSVILIIIAFMFIFASCAYNTSEQKAKKVLKQTAEIAEDTVTGYEYAEKAGIEEKKIEKAFEKADNIIAIESVDSYMNEVSANREVNTIDLRIAKVTGKDGKKYTIAFDGIRGTLFGIIDEDGNNLVDPSTISEDFADIVLGDTYVSPEE